MASSDGWLDPERVREWLLGNSLPSGDVVALAEVCLLTEKYVERYRFDRWTTDPDTGEAVYDPDAEVYQGAVMYAAKVARRRNNPSGTETFGDAGLVFTPRFDAQVDAALHTGAYLMPGVG